MLLNCRALYNSNANGVTPYAVERAILTCSSAAVTDFIVERSPKSVDRLELEPLRHGGTKSVLHVLSSIAKFPGHGFRLELKGFSWDEASWTHFMRILKNNQTSWRSLSIYHRSQSDDALAKPYASDALKQAISNNTVLEDIHLYGYPNGEVEDITAALDGILGCNGSLQSLCVEYYEFDLPTVAKALRSNTHLKTLRVDEWRRSSSSVRALERPEIRGQSLVPLLEALKHENTTLEHAILVCGLMSRGLTKRGANWRIRVTLPRN